MGVTSVAFPPRHIDFLGICPPVFAFHQQSRTLSLYSSRSFVHTFATSHLSPSLVSPSLALSFSLPAHTPPPTGPNMHAVRLLGHPST